MSDVYHLWRKRIPSVYFGPGTLEQCHVSDEHIALADIHNAARIYTLVAARALSIRGLSENELMAAIDTDYLTQFAQKLVQLPSENPPGDEKLISDYLLHWFEERDIPTRVVESSPHRPNIIAEIKGNGNGPTLLFNGHVDVVPAGPDWSIEPYAGIIRNGTLYGRGACDMKGGLAAMLTVADVMNKTKANFNGSLLFTVVSDEETGGEKGTGLLVDQGHIDADMAIVAEPSDFKLSISEGALIWLTFTSRGTRTHTVNSTGAVNAVENMARMSVELINLRDELVTKYPDDPPKLTTNTITGGLKVNIVPDHCEANVDFRFAPNLGFDISQALTMIDERLRALKQRHPSFDVTYRYEAKEGFVQPEKTPIVRLIQEATRDVLGHEAQWWRRYQ